MVNDYKILRVMNNNVILASNIRKNTEVVLMGSGLGFGKKKNQIIGIKDSVIEKAFVTGDKNLKQSYLQMLEEVNGDIVGLCTEILMKAEQILGTLSERSFIVIVDHISFAIEKLKKDISIENPFAFEIKHLYPDEYSIGEYARRRIMEDMSIDITEDEVGFIALHLNAAKQNKVVSDTLKNTRIIKGMIGLVESELEITLMDYPRLYNRLLLHLRGFIWRIEEGESSSKHPLYDETIKACQKAHEVALKISAYLSREKHIHLPETETFYLTLHLDRLIRKSQS